MREGVCGGGVDGWVWRERVWWWDFFFRKRFVCDGSEEVVDAGMDCFSSLCFFFFHSSNALKMPK